MRLPLPFRPLHTSARPSLTAQSTALVRALETTRPAEQRIVTDEFASLFLDDAGALTLRALRHGGRLVRRAERTPLVGIGTSVLCRHRFIDEHLLAALEQGMRQVVVLGAGYDTRAYRFAAALGDRPVFEVDLPPISRRKASLLAACPIPVADGDVRRVEIDFRSDSLADRLRDNGFTAGAPTFVVWEGVAMYLTRAAVTETLRALAGLCGAGSVLAMDCWGGASGTDVAARTSRLGIRAIALVGEPVTFTIGPAAMTDLLSETGFTVTDLTTGAQLTERFATDGRRCDGGLYALAARRS